MKQLYRRAVFGLKAFRRVSQLTRSGRRPDWIYTFHNYDLITGALFRIAGYKWVVDVLDPPNLVLEDVPGALRQRRVVKVALLYLFVLLAKLAIRRAHLVIVSAPDPNTGFAALLRTEYRVPPEKLVAVPNGVDPELILSSPPLEPGPGEALRALYVGTVGTQRGTFFLLDVIAEVRRHVPINLMIVGPAEGDAGIRLQAQISEMHLDEDVQWLGPLPHSEVIERIDRCHLGLYPFPNSGVLDGVIPIKVGEYMARGKPVVASDLTGVRALVADGCTGFLVQPLLLEAWVRALVALAQDERMRLRMGMEGAARAKNLAWPLINESVVSALAAF